MLYPPLPVDSMINARDSKGEHRDIEEGPLHAFASWDGRYYINGKYQDVDWMFWTGTLDRNGKEIWDGDILKVTYINYFDNPEKRYVDKEFIAVVKYIQHQGYFGVCDISMDECGYPEPDVLFCRSGYWEKLGNRYENPELIGDFK